MRNQGFRQDFDLWPYAAASLPSAIDAVRIEQVDTTRRRWVPRLVERVFTILSQDAAHRRPR